MSVNKPDTFTINWVTGPEETPTEHIYWIIEGVIGCLVGDEEWMVNCGHWDAPFFCLNSTQSVHHAYSHLDDLLWALLHTKAFEGTDSELGEGDRQRIETWFEQHQLLKVWVSSVMMEGSPTRSTFDVFCIRLAAEMGEPVNDIKAAILALMIELSTTTDASRAMALINQMMTLDKKRLKQIKNISKRVNWRAAAVAETNARLRKSMKEIGLEFQRLHDQHVRLVAGSVSVEDFDHQLAELSLLEHRLKEIKLKPYNKLAEHDLRDASEYRELIKRGDFEAARRRLAAATVAHKGMDDVEHRIKVVRFRLFIAQRQRGAKRLRMLAVAHRELMETGAIINLRQAQLLRRNSLRSALGRINDALVHWNQSKPDLIRIAKVLKTANRAFG